VDPERQATQFVTLPEFSTSVASWSFHVPFIGDVAPLKEIGTKGLAAALIILLTGINYVGVRFGGLVQNIFTIAKVAAMLLLVLGAFLLPTGGAMANLTTPSAEIHLGGLVWLLALPPRCKAPSGPTTVGTNSPASLVATRPSRRENQA
jgi:APA family basic amino acid/polyamine antiporter